MKPKPLKTLKVTFNILDQQREHTTSKQRNYLVDNVRKVIQSPAVQERLRKRELVGYFGHYLREHAGKMHLDEKVMVPTPGGGHILVDAVPACVCTAIDIDDDGNLTHVEEIADNLEGRKTLSLFESGIGGFSWACDGGVYRGNTLISDLAGFDYVRQPLFSSNRPYVLDSAAQDSEAERAQLVLDSMVDLGVDEGVATGALQAFYASSANEAEHYRTGLEGQMLINAEVMAELEETKALLDAAQGRDSRRSGLLADMAKARNAAETDQVDAFIKSYSQD